MYKSYNPLGLDIHPMELAGYLVLGIIILINILSIFSIGEWTGYKEDPSSFLLIGLILLSTGTVLSRIDRLERNQNDLLRHTKV